jgi:hypothetical protein
MFLRLCWPKSAKSNSDFTPNMIVGRRRCANASRLRDPFKSRSDVDAIPEDVVALDQDVPKINPDPK